MGRKAEHSLIVCLLNSFIRCVWRLYFYTLKFQHLFLTYSMFEMIFMLCYEDNELNLIFILTLQNDKMM